VSALLTDPTDARGSLARRRWVGAAVVVLLAVVVAGLQFWRDRSRGEVALAAGFAELAAAIDAPVAERRAHLDRAEATFARATGAVTLEPLALIGLGLCEPLAAAAGRTPPPPPVAPDDDTARRYGRSLLEHGRPDLLLRWAASPVARGRQAALAPLVRFAAAWQGARKQAPGVP